MGGPKKRNQNIYNKFIKFIFKNFSCLLEGSVNAIN